MKNKHKIKSLLQQASQLEREVIANQHNPELELKKEFQLLKVWKKLAEIDSEQQEIYLSLIRAHINSDELNKKINLLNDEDKQEAKNTIQFLEYDCDNLIEPKRKRVTKDKELPKNKKQKVILESYESDDYETDKDSEAEKETTNKKNQQPQVSLYSNTPTLFSKVNAPPKEVQHTPKQVHDFFIKTILGFLEVSLNKLTAANLVFQALLFEMARFHNQDCDSKPTHFKAALTQALFEKSLILGFDNQIYSELLTFQKKQCNFLIKENIPEKTDDRLNNYREKLKSFEKLDLQASIKQYFWDSIDKYFSRIQNEFSSQSCQIFADLFKFLSHPVFLTKMEFINPNIQSLNIDNFKKAAETLIQMSHKTEMASTKGLR